jgi:hypothetical protein
MPFLGRLCPFAKGFAKMVFSLEGYLHVVSVDVSKILAREKAKRGNLREKSYYPFDLPPYSCWMRNHKKNSTTRVRGNSGCF